MALAQASFQLGDGPTFSATHVLVKRSGPEIVSAFVHDDGLTRDPRGFAVSATLGTVGTFAALLEQLRGSSPAAEAMMDRRPLELPRPDRPYVPVWEPLRLVFITVHVLEVHEVAYMAFALVDPFAALPQAQPIAHQAGVLPPSEPVDLLLPPDQPSTQHPAEGKPSALVVPAPRVALALETFIAWITTVQRTAEEMRR